MEQLNTVVHGTKFLSSTLPNRLLLRRWINKENILHSYVKIKEIMQFIQFGVTEYLWLNETKSTQKDKCHVLALT